MCAGGTPAKVPRILRRADPDAHPLYAYTRYGITHLSGYSIRITGLTAPFANLLENEIYLGNTVNMKYA